MLQMDQRNKLSAKAQCRERILAVLKENGYRITSQRKLILDIILDSGCSSCKEIYYEASQKDPSIGIATVYRMVNKLEELEMIDRRSLYRIRMDEFQEVDADQAVLIEGEKKIDLTAGEWFENLKQYLKNAGFGENESISVVVKRVS